MNPVQGTDPQANVVVRASAGTGKTWLLASRIIRLLFEGAAPAAILAISFTRKAAAEIDQRVATQLFRLAQLDDQDLNAQLRAWGIRPSTAMLERARGLYEEFLRADPGLRTSTFHAFCGELLRRFPLEAGVPPGFTVTEHPEELLSAAWVDLERAARREPNGDLAQALDLLLEEVGVYGVRLGLNEFLHHRSDWWAYTEDQSDPVRHAVTQLAHQLRLPSTEETDPGPPPDSLRQELRRYAELLSRHATKTNLERAARLADALAAAPMDARTRWREIFACFFNQHGEGPPSLLKPSDSLRKSLGQSAMEELCGLHTSLQSQLADLRQQTRRLATWRLSCAWYRAGQHLLDLFQRRKIQLGVLDFADLEWQAYRLLNRGRHAEWVQYKLDQRVDHLLVDEFQDTNPTQWRLLLPLLQEIAAGSVERGRSIFLVGDEKQSIYGFRRADARLFSQAHTWLARQLEITTLAQHVSRRSSPAIIEFVNAIFHDNEHGLLDFPRHDTHHTDLWGAVHVLPLLQPNQDETSRGAEWRQPLQSARVLDEDERYTAEAARIATLIDELRGQPVVHEHGARPLDYGDVIILLRDRTHAWAYEQGLRLAGIPYQGADRGTLLDTLEVRDMQQLLRLLVSPKDNLAVAWVLRSPLFACSEDDLLRLAQFEPQEADWLVRLTRLAPQLPPDTALHYAARQLSTWQDWADRIPVHDLLDRIFNEADVIPRYQSATPEHLRDQIGQNLTRFLELALDLDSGRYPSLTRFLERLQLLARYANAAVSEPPSMIGNRVRIMTIHAAKGLEAPAIILADAARPARRDTGLRALVEWPAERAAPEHFHLITRQDGLDDISLQILERQEQSARYENLNLLYVALTRAQQYLFVSGCQPARGDNRGWYGLIEARLRECGARPGFQLSETATEGSPINTYGSIQIGKPPTVLESGASAVASPPIDTALCHPLPMAAPTEPLAPSRADTEWDRWDAQAQNDTAGIARGIALHRFLQLLSHCQDRAACRDELMRAYRDSLDTHVFEQYFEEACGVLDHPAWRGWFDDRDYEEARNEFAMLYRHGGRDVYGVIDRIVIRASMVDILDYKTHRHAQADSLSSLASQYTTQMRLYAAGAAKLWPGRRVRAWLVFTACREALEIPLA